MGLIISNSNVLITRELIEYLKDNKPLCASIKSTEYENEYLIELKQGYTEEQYKSFIERISNITIFDYDIEGYIWITEHKWIERDFYNEAGYWYQKDLPIIPKHLLWSN